MENYYRSCFAVNFFLPVKSLLTSFRNHCVRICSKHPAIDSIASDGDNRVINGLCNKTRGRVLVPAGGSSLSAGRVSYRARAAGGRRRRLFDPLHNLTSL